MSAKCCYHAGSSDMHSMAKISKYIKVNMNQNKLDRYIYLDIIKIEKYQI